jgi:hypothetical protein
VAPLADRLLRAVPGLRLRLGPNPASPPATPGGQAAHRDEGRPRERRQDGRGRGPADLHRAGEYAPYEEDEAREEVEAVTASVTLTAACSWARCSVLTPSLVES